MANNEPLSPVQIAREALRRLALERRPPTPENYRQIYNIISGNEDTGAAEDYRLRVALNLLSCDKQNAELAALVEHAGAERTWHAARAALVALIDARSKALAATQEAHPVASVHGMPAVSSTDAAAAAAQSTVFRRLLVRTLESRLAVNISVNDDALQESRLLAGRVRNAGDEMALTALESDFRRFHDLVDTRTEDMLELRDRLTNLLCLLTDAIGEFVLEDTWITHQLDALREILARPLRVETVDEAEQFVREVRRRQHTIKKELTETKARLHSAATSFLDQLAAMSSCTGSFGEKITQYTARIEQANDIRTVSNLLAELLHDTRDMQHRADHAHTELLEARSRAQAAEQRIHDLEKELVAVSEKVREDQLTGTLNRRGFDEAFRAETARAQRSGHRLCVALLDVDNFKQLNDRYGHRAGDGALIHLARVLRETVRPNDIVARYGGEEFLILLPETPVDVAEKVLIRLQRELTRRFFLHEEEHLLMTFSAGIAEWQSGEDQDAVFGRADAAQYQAKATGKNKVIVAPTPVSASAPESQRASA